MKAEKTRAFILKKTKYSESDLIIQALTPQGEKLSLLARGALKSKKRFSGGVLEPTHFVQLQFRKGAESGRLGVLEEATLVDDFTALRGDYDRLELALFVCNAVYRVSQEGDHNSESLFNLTGNTLKALTVAQDLNLFKLHFCLKFLFQQGVLQIEDWMKPYLKIPITEHLLMQTDTTKLRTQLSWIDSEMSLYLKSASLN